MTNFYWEELHAFLNMADGVKDDECVNLETEGLNSIVCKILRVELIHVDSFRMKMAERDMEECPSPGFTFS